jgi:hypothetical protein
MDAITQNLTISVWDIRKEGRRAEPERPGDSVIGIDGFLLGDNKKIAGAHYRSFPVKSAAFFTGTFTAC